MNHKICTGCKIDKPLDDFSVHSKGRFGRNPRCKECRNAYSASFFEANREHVLARQKRTRDKNYRMNEYGLAQEEYERMYEAQNGCCKICAKFHEVLCVDHCHTTGKVRGLLCRSCNFGIGHLKDSMELLDKAAAYLQAAC